MQRLLMIVIIFCYAPALFAENQQKIIPQSSPAYEALEKLYLEQGLTFPSQALPYSVDELGRALKRIDFESLSGPGKDAYTYIEDEMRQEVVYNEGRDFLFNTGVKLTLESYLHLNPERELWTYGYSEREPLLHVPLEVWCFNSLYADLELDVKQEPFVITRVPDNHFNIITDLYHVDMGFPFRTFLSLGGNFWNLQFGRDTLNWGNGTTGNMLLSDAPDFHDFIRIALYWEKFKFSTAYISLEPWVVGSLGEDSGSVDNYYKAYFTHRLKFRIAPWWSITVTEAAIFKNKYPDLRYLSPMMIFHNWYIDEWQNSLMSLEIDITPLKGLTIYTQGVLDEFRTPMEEEEFNSTQSNSWGALAGCQWVLPVGPGYLELILEYVYANPWLYTNDHILSAVFSRRRITSDTLHYWDRPLGYYTGPDAQVTSFLCGYKRYGYYALSLEYRLEYLGDHTIYTAYDNESDPISDLPDMNERPGWEQRIRMHGQINPVANLELCLGADIIWIIREDLEDLELCCSVAIEF